MKLASVITGVQNFTNDALCRLNAGDEGFAWDLLREARDMLDSEIKDFEASRVATTPEEVEKVFPKTMPLGQLIQKAEFLVSDASTAQHGNDLEAAKDRLQELARLLIREFGENTDATKVETSQQAGPESTVENTSADSQ